MKPINVRIERGLPPPAKPEEMVAIDLEIFGIPEGKVHRPVGTFACASVFLDRNDGDDPVVYQTTDPHDLPELVERLKDGRWIFQNGIFDLRQMRRWAVIKPRKIWDTQVVEQGLFGGYYTNFNLNSLAVRYLGALLDKATREEFTTATEMTPQMQRYAAIDAVVTLRIAKCQIEYVLDKDVSMDHYWLADHPALWAILDMAPVRVDVDRWAEEDRKFAAIAHEIRGKYSFNINSTQQVSRKLTDLTGRIYASTDADTLTALREERSDEADLVAFLDDVLAFRKAAKLHGTYGENWLTRHVEDDGGVYPSWKDVGASTGRLACGEPNLQNIPAREYPIFRTFFIASPGHILMGADVAQQEPRILAKLSHDKYLTDILVQGKSPHLAVGAEIFHDPEFSKKDPRYALAKQANLGISYGMTAVGLSNKAGVPQEEAEDFLDHYFRIMPGVKNYITRYRKIAERQGYVETLTGRRVWVNPYNRKWENNAINAPIQGTAADQMKIAMGFIHRESANLGLPFCLSMVIHDEMVNDTPLEIKKDYDELIAEAWREAGLLTLGEDIPMVIEPFSGQNWGSKKE